MKWRVALAIIALASVIIGSFAYYQWSEKKLARFAITFLDVGQGDSALIQLGNGETMLVDCGADRSVLAPLGAVLPFYRRTIEYLLVTHFDLDHYGGCLDVLKRYTIKNLITNGEHKDNALFTIWQSLVDVEQAHVIVSVGASTWQIGQIRLEFLSPDPSLRVNPKDKKSNNRSIVFRLVANERYLFTGDIEEQVEKALIGKYCHGTASSTMRCEALEADVLKAPHHGSDTSSSDPFLEAINPKRVVVSVGKNNRFGHPSPRVVKRFERKAITILRTDVLGSITMP